MSNKIKEEQKKVKITNKDVETSLFNFQEEEIYKDDDFKKLFDILSKK